jgi:hypothetical protein
MPRASIAFSFAVDGETAPCVHREIELRVDGRIIPVRATTFGFIIPPAFRRSSAAKTPMAQKVDIRVTCGGKTFDFTDEDVSRLVPGAWLLEVGYPTSWLTSAAESPVLESGTWLSTMIWGCRECQPVPRTVIPHFDLPSAFAESLRREQPGAEGARAVQIAYALVVFNIEPEKNLASLTDRLKGCASPMEKPPDSMVCNNPQLAEDLVNLYWRGESELLGGLLQLADSHSDVAGEMGSFYADLLDRRAGQMLGGLQNLAPEKQLAVCVRAGENERDAGDARFRRIRMNLQAAGSATARQCLQQAEAAFH